MLTLGYIGWVILIIGWIWTIIAAFKTGGVLWGIINIIPIQPLLGIITAAMKKVPWQPVIVTIVGAVIMWGFGGAAMLSSLK